jgi:hypothetical protein
MRIKKEIGDGHENDFIAMIQDLDSLAATKFLYSLYLLESNEWKYEKKERKESNIDLGPGSVEMVIATVYGSVVHGNRDDTDYIRKKFFLKLASEGEIDIKYAKFLIQNSARVS